MTKQATIALTLFLLAAVLLPSSSAAEWGIKPGSVEVKALDSSGNPDTRAGAHPDRLAVDFAFSTAGSGTGARDLMFEFAPGLTGSPIATKTCSRTVFELEAENCPQDSQVGRFIGNYIGGESIDEPIFNLVPAPDQLAVLAFHPFWQTELELKVRPDDYGLSISTHDMPQLPFEKGRVELWGIPADRNGSTERAAFLTTPTECGPMAMTLRTRSWQVGAPWLSETAESAPFTGCEELPFEPGLGFRLSESKPDSPTGADIDLNLTEHSDPGETAGRNMKDVHIDLPPDLTFSPAGAEGRETCSDGQFGAGTDSEVTCPFHSRVGSVEVSTPALGEVLFGSMFLGEERPGERFRLLVHASAAGIDFKALAALVANPKTGQLSAELRGLPQFPVRQISLDFEGGAHALLATPLSCGSATARGSFTPSVGGSVGSAASVSIGTSCAGPPPFSPTTLAGGTDLSAGKSTGFSLTLSRQDGEQLPKGYSVTLPPGLTAKLTTVDVCPTVAAASGACSSASQVGTAVAEVGSGPNPARLSGAVYLTAGYKNAPYGLSAVFRAAVGPFDLGTLNVQGTLALDPHTGQVMLGYQLPSVFNGVPVRFRMLGFDFPRGGFLVNPTSCEPEQLAAAVSSVDGRVTTQSVPFNVGQCDRLGFRPKFSAAFSRRGRHAKWPELSFKVRMPKGNTNLRRFSVAFPRIVEFHNSAVREICSRGDALEDRCRAGARVGTGTAYTPLLAGALRGPVYLVQPEDNDSLPDLWTSVEGAGVKLQLKSRSDRRGGRFETELVDIPDLPLSSFTMRVDGGDGARSPFSLGSRACSGPARLRTPVELEGQDGAERKMKTQLDADCSKPAGKERERGRYKHKRGR
jgi:hypothetical protein